MRRRKRRKRRGRRRGGEEEEEEEERYNERRKGERMPTRVCDLQLLLQQVEEGGEDGEASRTGTPARRDSSAPPYPIASVMWPREIDVGVEGPPLRRGGG